MKEIAFIIEHEKDCEKITVLEDRIKRTASYYHKGTSEAEMIIDTVADWYGYDLTTMQQLPDLEEQQINI